MLDRVGRSLRFSRLDQMALIDLPAAMPGIVTGLRLGVTASLLVTITCEMLLSTNGIGAFVQRSQESFHVVLGTRRHCRDRDYGIDREHRIAPGRGPAVVLALPRQDCREMTPRARSFNLAR